MLNLPRIKTCRMGVEEGPERVMVPSAVIRAAIPAAILAVERDTRLVKEANRSQSHNQFRILSRRVRLIFISA